MLEVLGTRIGAILKLAIVLSLPFLIVACSSSSENVIPTNPDMSQFENGYHDYGIGFEAEKDYSNIIAFTEFETYTPDFELINITVKNENPGKGFYFYMIPFLEKMEDGEWIRLNYDTPLLSNESNWGFCGIEGDKTSQFSTRTAILSDFLIDKPSTGDYRAVVFVGATIIYAPFKIIK